MPERHPAGGSPLRLLHFAAGARAGDRHLETPRAEAEPPPSLQLIRIGPLEAGSAQVTEDAVEHRGELLDAAGQAGERRSTRGVEQVAHVTEQVSEQIARSG